MAALLASQGFSLSLGISAEARTISAASNAVPTSVTEKTPPVVVLPSPTPEPVVVIEELPAVAAVPDTVESPAQTETAPPETQPTAAPAPEVVVAQRLTTSEIPVIANLPDKARGLLEAMNAARVAEGLPPLEIDATLEDVALSRARSLVTQDYFAHYGPDGGSAFSELAARGVTYALAGENLARNNFVESRTVDAAFQGLMASPGHRANILEPQFARVGVAAVQTGRMWVYVTVFMN